MREELVSYLIKLGVSEELSKLLAIISFGLIIIILALIVNLLAKKIILHYVKRFAAKTTTKADDIFLKNKVFDNLAHIAPGGVVYAMANLLGDYSEGVQKLAMTYIIIIVTIAIFKSFDSIVEYTRLRSPSKGGPLKGILQVAKIAVIVFTVLMLIVNFLGNATALAIVGSIGGMSAVLMLVFKDSILGLVAGIQLSSEGLLKLGDWLEMPKYSADGEVVDISLTKITVRNWDKTYTTVPAYKFIEDSFKNWEGMTEAGGRRIKRSIDIDMNSIGFLTTEQMKALDGINVLRPYFEGKLEEISQFNKGAETEHVANIRKLTNVGTFRAYVKGYLKAHPGIHETYTLLVRQLPPTEKGLPIELYCFTNETAWATYEGIQADIFDHLLAILPEFGLKVYQGPTGNDFSNAFTSTK